MTGVQIDSSRLPPVQEVCRDFAVLEDGALAYCLQEQEIELHYASNVQKNQMAQNDLRMAKRLQNQEVEAQKSHDSRPPKESPGGDPKNAQEDLPMKRGNEGWKKGKDQERAKRFQDLEKEESGQSKQRSSRGTRDGVPEALHWEMARLELQIQQQFQEDEELARKLQQEEEREQTRMRAKRNREQDDDYRAAQVAQDEEIARYLQDKELQSQWDSPPQERQQTEPPRTPEGQSPCNPEKDSWPGGRRSPLRIQAQEDPNETGEGASAEKRPQFCRNIAEVLDPTFQAAKMGTPSDGMDLGSKAPSPGPLARTDSSAFDYPRGGPAPVFVSPTKRQPDRVGCPKSGNKREGCRQQ